MFLICIHTQARVLLCMSFKLLQSHIISFLQLTLFPVCLYFERNLPILMHKFYFNSHTLYDYMHKSQGLCLILSWVEVQRVYNPSLGLPRCLRGKESTCQCRRSRRHRSLGQEDPLEEMATHSSILAGKIPWTKEPGRLQSMGSQRIRHDSAPTHNLYCNEWTSLQLPLDPDAKNFTSVYLAELLVTEENLLLGFIGKLLP